MSAHAAILNPMERDQVVSHLKPSEVESRTSGPLLTSGRPRHALAWLEDVREAVAEARRNHPELASQRLDDVKVLTNQSGTRLTLLFKH